MDVDPILSDLKVVETECELFFIAKDVLHIETWHADTWTNDNYLQQEAFLFVPYVCSLISLLNE